MDERRTVEQLVRSHGVVSISTLLRLLPNIPVTQLMSMLQRRPFRLFVRTVEAVRDRDADTQPYLLVTCSEKAMQLTAASLAQYAGLAEAALLLGADPRNWFHVDVRPPPSHWRTVEDLITRRSGHVQKMRLSLSPVWQRPDAVWVVQVDGRTDERWVEYDRGSYGDAHCLMKIQSALEFGKTLIWADPSARRLHRRQQQFSACVAEYDRRDPQQLTFSGQPQFRRKHDSATFRPLLTGWHVGSEAQHFRQWLR